MPPMAMLPEATPVQQERNATDIYQENMLVTTEEFGDLEFDIQIHEVCGCASPFIVSLTASHSQLLLFLFSNPTSLAIG